MLGRKTLFSSPAGPSSTLLQTSRLWFDLLHFRLPDECRFRLWGHVNVVSQQNHSNNSDKGALIDPRMSCTQWLDADSPINRDAALEGRDSTLSAGINSRAVSRKVFHVGVCVSYFLFFIFFLERCYRLVKKKNTR